MTLQVPLIPHSTHTQYSLDEINKRLELLESRVSDVIVSVLPSQSAVEVHIELGKGLEVAVDGLGGTLVGRLKSIVELCTLTLASVQKDLKDLGLKHSRGVLYPELLLEVSNL